MLSSRFESAAARQKVYDQTRLQTLGNIFKSILIEKIPKNRELVRVIENDYNWQILKDSADRCFYISVIPAYDGGSYQAECVEFSSAKTNLDLVRAREKALKHPRTWFSFIRPKLSCDPLFNQMMHFLGTVPFENFLFFNEMNVLMDHNHRPVAGWTPQMTFLLTLLYAFNRKNSRLSLSDKIHDFFPHATFKMTYVEAESSLISISQQLHILDMVKDGSILGWLESDSGNSWNPISYFGPDSYFLALNPRPDQLEKGDQLAFYLVIEPKPGFRLSFHRNPADQIVSYYLKLINSQDKLFTGLSKSFSLD